MTGPRRTRRPRKRKGSTWKGWTISSVAAPSMDSYVGSAQAPGKDALLRVQAVLGLLPHRRARPVDDLGGDFLVAMGGQAMHEDGVGLRLGHQRRIDAIGPEHGAALFLVLVLAHRNPSVGDDAIGAGHSSRRVGRRADARAFGLGPIQRLVGRKEFRGTGDPQLESETRRGMNPADQHVVAVAAPGHDLALGRALELL